ncbi:putative minor tail protein [Nocardia phage NBR1]|uniref:putative minor tail protein n=1 Tax=Nocardia phage NBR1 TaxID=1109711 RepID=UPI00023EEDDB|nr:putative minor tail protein [Nocardia phage NBR1]AEV52237.1 putative minor tail protein [Nocardia phage NBR1]
MTTMDWANAHYRQGQIRHPLDDVAYVIFRSHLGKDFVLSGRGAGAGGHLATGVSGFGQLATTVLTQGTAQGVERFTGYVVKRREIHTKISIAANTPAGFYVRNEDWWNHQSITSQGYLMVSTMLSGLRIARVRLGEDVGDPAQVKDASFTRARDYSDFYWMAEDPFVLGAQERARWQNKTLQGTGRLILNNPGEFTAYPEIIGTGPGRWSIQGDDGSMVPFPPVATGDAIRVQTDRLRPGVTNAMGINLWGQMAGRRLRLSVPPRSSKTIRVEVTAGVGTSAILSVIRPKYGRLW